MTSKHRHGLPRRKPELPAKNEIDTELPELEPVDDDLPVLQPVDEDLPTLEPVGDGPIQITCAASDEATFDTVLTVKVAPMDKQAVLDAVEAPLRRAASAAASQLRHQRVLVHFTGDAMIGSAVKDLVARVMQVHKPLKACVRRGFGDESVHEGALPQVKVATTEQAGTRVVEIATGDLEAVDLPMALQAHLGQLTTAARGKKFELRFTGSARPDAGVRDMLTKVLQEAGAARAAVGERALFDVDWHRRVKVERIGGAATVSVTPADDEATTIEALSMVLPQHAGDFAGAIVRLQFAREPRAAELGQCVESCRAAKPARIELAGAGEPQVVWPAVLAVLDGRETTVRVQPNGRSRAAVLAAFGREVGEHSATTKGKAVVVDWPAGFALDDEVANCLAQAIPTLAARTLACTVGGEEREPFVPAPASVSVNKGVHVLRIDSEAGKPPELQRAVDRCLRANGNELRGAAVRVQIVGAGAVSRTMMRSVCDSIEAAGAMRLEVDDHGTVDVLLPPMLAITRSGGDAVRITAVAGGRDAAQEELALQRELDAAQLPAGAQVSVVASATSAATTEAILVALVARGAARVVLDGPAAVQVHPPLFAAPEKKGGAVRVTAQPDADESMLVRQVEREMPGLLAKLGAVSTATVTIVWPRADAGGEPFQKCLQALLARKPAKVMLDRGDAGPEQVHPAPVPVPKPVQVPTPVQVPRPAAAAARAPDAAASGAAAPTAAPAPKVDASGPSLITLLGRRDEAVPPIVLLGVEHGADPMHIAKVEAQLQEHLPRFRGRCVLLVMRRGDADVPVRSDGPLLSALRNLVPTTAAATLVFRGPDAQQRPHFQVLHSTLRALPAGGVFADPRQRR
ncbi:MAG TPA: hypothetical protein VFZ65_04420 [Planctomycetota bacterium]|nr:hypothetical protein [Planctomycetota bacterium]